MSTFSHHLSLYSKLNKNFDTKKEVITSNGSTSAQHDPQNEQRDCA